MNGNTAGTGYDQVNVTGTVSVTNSILNLSGTRSAHDGTILTIINNDGADAITGAFQGLAEGVTTPFNGVVYKASYVGGTGNDAVLTAMLANTSTALASGTNPSDFGQSVTFTATVTSTESGTPTGTVTFLDGSTTLGMGTLNGSGVATFSTSALLVGSHSITAVYGADSNFTTSTSSTVSQTVNQDATTSAVVSSTNPSMFGQSATFTATITANAPGSGTPTGTATFLDGSTTLGTGTLNGSGIATFTTSNLSIGSHSITVVYGGDTSFITSTSAPVTQVVNQDATTSVVACSANPSVSGQSVTFTATITANAPGSGTPTGTVTFLDGSTTLSTGTLNGSGVTTFSTSALTVGSHSITVDYGGDTDFTTSTSAIVTQVVNQDATTSVAVSSANPSVSGQSVTFTATITANAPGSGTPTGTVTFLDGSTTLGTGTLNGSGVTTFNTSALTVGSHSITVDYGGDTNFTTSTSAIVTQVVNQDATTSVVASSVNPSVFGQSVTFTATITANAPGSGTPIGTVTFLDGSTTLGVATLNGSGVATLSTSALPVGSHSITVVYGGDTDFVTSTSTIATQVVDQDATTAAVVSSANPSVFGQSVTFTATISANAPGAGVLSGTVTFLDGSTTLGTGTLNSSGIATFSTSALTVGSHSITASYGGDADFTTSTSSTLNQTVNQDATTSAVVPSANPSVFGQSVTFTATITANAPGSGTPTGTMTFLDGSTTLGTGTLNGSGVATFTTSSLSVGSHSITVVYGGDTDFTTSTSTAATQVVNQDATASVVVSSANPSVFGQSVTFTATITANAPGSGTPTGTVTFLDGSTTLGTGTLNGSGVATLALSGLNVGSHSITVVYGGDPDYLTSTSAALTQVVNQGTSTSVVVSSANASVFGQSVTFTATITVNAPGSGTPTGTVTFLDGSTNLGIGTLDGSGLATFTTSGLAVGTHSITAVYGADIDFDGSTSSALTQVVGQDATSSVVAASANPSVFGESVTFTATVTSAMPGSGIPAGTVTFLDGLTSLGTGTLNGAGIATITTSAIAVGADLITCVYGGDGNFTGSTSSILTQTVFQDPTSSTTVTSSANPSVFGQSITFTATIVAVAPGSGIPTGSVTFMDGSSTLGTGILDGAGSATFTTSSLSVGDHSIMAVYPGSPDFTPSISSAFNQVVDQDTTTSIVAASANPSVFGQSVTFTATITADAPGSGTPTGTVTFLDGSTTLGTGTLDGSGVATFSTSALAVGSHSITVDYGGDTDFTTSTSVIVTQVVNQGATTSAVVSSANPSVFDQSVTFTATITADAPGTGALSGTVTFLDGTTTLGTGTLNGFGVATFTTSGLSVGSHSITVVYGGDTDFITSTSAIVTQVVDQDATTSAIVSSANPSAFGQSVTFTATITANVPGSGTPAGTVTFLDGSTTLGAGTLNGSGIATFSTSALTDGSHSVTVVYGGDTDFIASTSAIVTQVVDQDATTSAVVSSANPSVFGQSVTFTATITADAPGTGTPSGTVTFLDGSATLGTGTLNGFGVATFTTSGLSVGGHSITAVYGGDTDFIASTSAIVTQVVGQDATTSAVVSSANPSVFGQSVTFTATVNSDAPGSGIPTGTVTFMDGPTTLGTGTLNSSGVATFTTSGLSVTGHSITAVYGGDTDFTGSTSAILTQTVNEDAADSVVVSSAGPSVFGQSITFTATVTANSPGSGIPTGSVTFEDGSTVLGTGLLNVSGVATFGTSSLNVGSHSITAVYGGDTDFISGTASILTQVVNKDATTSAVASATNPSVFGRSITLTATVASNAPGSGTPTGSVTFMDGSTIVGSATLNGSGIATFSTASLSVASHSITVIYAGDADFTTSTSSILTQTVDQDSTTSVVASSANPSVFGQSVTFTATITANTPGAGVPNGSVTFEDGSTTLGIATLNSSGVATFSTSALTVRTHSISVFYGGASDFMSSTSSTLGQTVNRDATTSVVASSANPSVFTQSITFTATVTANTPGSGVPTGSVTFMDGSTILGTRLLNGSGIATFTTASLTVGSHSITAAYNGTPNYLASTSSAQAQTVVAPNATKLVISNQPATLTAGETGGMLVVDVTTNNGVIDSAFNSAAVVSIVRGPADGKLSGSLTAMAQNGIATFSSLEINQQGNYVLKISANGITTETASITVDPGPASQLTVPVTPGASWQFGSISPAIKVAVTDRYGNLVTTGNPSVTATIAAGPAGAALSGTRTVSAINGYATFTNLSLNLPGTYSLAFTSGNNSPVAVDDLTIVGIPARRYLLNGSPLSSRSILMQELHNAPSTIDLGPPAVTGLPTVTVLSDLGEIAAANFNNQIANGNQLFAAGGAPEPSVDPILDSAAESLEKFLEST